MEREKILQKIKARNIEQDNLMAQYTALKDLNKKDFFEYKLWHSLDELKTMKQANLTLLK